MKICNCQTCIMNQDRGANAKEGTLRVWWIPQVPENNPFYVYVKNIREAKLILSTLTDYDAYQFDHEIKPDYSNVGGLETFDGAEWSNWYNEDGEKIDDVNDEGESLKDGWDEPAPGCYGL